MPYTQLANLEFADIKTALKDYMRAQSDFTDYDFEGSALSQVLDVLAYNTYYTAFNTNMVVNEMFLDSATLRDNVVSLAKQIGYRPRSSTAPTATIKLIATYSGGGTAPDTFVLKKGTGFVTNFDDVLYQYVTVDDQEVPVLNLDGTSKVYFVEEIEDENYELFFGDGIFGKKLDNGNFVEISYLVTKGPVSNQSSSFSFSGIITEKGQTSSIPFTTSLTTVSASSGGATSESVSSIKKSAPRAYASQDRAVTSDDYQNIIKKIYPAVSDIITFGGEEDNPPEFGKVKVAIKPQNAIALSSFTKKDIEKKLKDYTVASVTPVVVDPSILYIELDSIISYKSATTTLTKAELQTKAITAVEDYIASSETEKFNGKFRHSKFASVIDGSDNAIISNITKVTLRKDFYPTLNSTFYYELCYLNEFKD